MKRVLSLLILFWMFLGVLPEAHSRSGSRNGEGSRGESGEQRGNGGDRRGNGGDAVVCRDANGVIIPPVELLDFEEAREERGIEVAFPEGETAKDIALAVVARFAEHSPKRAEFYRATIEAFSADYFPQYGRELVDVPDSNHRSRAQGCKVEQLIIQQTKDFPEDKRFLRDEDIWEAMDKNQQAGTMLHEAILTEAVLMNHPDSRNTRYLNSKLFEKDAQFTDQSFLALLENAYFPVFEVRDIYNKEFDYFDDWNGELSPINRSRRDTLFPAILQFYENGRFRVYQNAEHPSDSHRLRVLLAHPFIQAVSWQEISNWNPSVHRNLCCEFDRYEYFVDAGYLQATFTSRYTEFIYDEVQIAAKIHGQMVVAKVNERYPLRAYDDRSLEFFALGEGYLDPQTGLRFIEHIIVNPDGSVRNKQTVADFPAPEGWSFSGDTENSFVQLKENGFYHFVPSAAGLRATFRTEHLELIFTDFTESFLQASQPVPFGENFEAWNYKGIPLDPQSKAYGQTIGEDLSYCTGGWTSQDCYPYVTFFRNEGGYIHVKDPNPENFRIAAKIPFLAPVFGEQVSVRYIITPQMNEQNKEIFRFTPTEKYTVEVQGKSLQTYPGKIVRFYDRMVSEFTLAPDSPNVRLRRKNGSRVTLRPGGRVLLTTSKDGNEPGLVEFYYPAK